MKKDIYIIRNKINNKVYIGQTVNLKQRIQQYKTAVKKEYTNQIIFKAMQKYGFNNFEFSILESQVENYDEKEQYWIQYYNSLVPNGYNVAPGGQGVGNGVLAPGSSIKDSNILSNLIDDIITSEKSLIKLAEEYHISYGVINEINQGHTYYNKELHYPLRNSNKYSKDKLNQITYALKYELDKSLTDIAQEYEIDKSFLNDINQGHSYYREYLTYPIRKGKMKNAEEIYPQIKNLLLTSNIPQKDIAKQFNCSRQIVSDINCGRTGYDKTLKYPLRNEEILHHTCLSPNLLKQIEDDIKNSDLSMAAIGRKYEVPSPTICKINNGQIKKYYNSEYKYPLRKK